MDNSEYSSSYSEKGFWDKLANYAKSAGKEVVIAALKLYYAMELKKASPKQIVMIIAALGYFISPLDVIPDALPALGYTDDLAILLALIKTVGACMDSEVVAAANEKAAEWFDK